MAPEGLIEEGLLPEGPESARFTEDHRFVVEGGEETAHPQALAELEQAPAVRVTKTQARAAVNMKIAGAGYDDIARVLNYVDARAARRVVEDALAAAYPDESREALRRITGARLEDLMKKVARKTEPTVVVLDDFGRALQEDGKTVRAENPEQLSHIKVMADLISRHARVMGVEQIDVTITPTNEQYAATLRAALQQHNAAGPQEADPFAEEYLEAEIVEPEEGEL